MAPCRRSDYLPVDSTEELAEEQPDPEPPRFRALVAIALVLCLAATPAAAAHLVYSRPHAATPDEFWPLAPDEQAAFPDSSNLAATSARAAPLADATEAWEGEDTRAARHAAYLSMVAASHSAPGRRRALASARDDDDDGVVAAPADRVERFVTRLRARARVRVRADPGTT